MLKTKIKHTKAYLERDDNKYLKHLLSGPILSYVLYIDLLLR